MANDIISKMVSKLKGLNASLPGLMLGIVLFGIICQVIGILFVKDRAGYSIGLWVGVITALFMTFHMAYTLDGAVELGVKGAQAAVTRQNLVRYAIVVVILAVMMVTKIGNPLASFLGIMGIKFGAYMQPVFARFSRQNTGVCDTAENVHDENIYDENVYDENVRDENNADIDGTNKDLCEANTDVVNTDVINAQHMYTEDK